MDAYFDELVNELGRVGSRPRIRARYGGSCYRCGGAIQVEPESQEFGLGADLLVLDDDGSWIHADCF